MVAKDPNFLHVDSEDSDQTGGMQKTCLKTEPFGNTMNLQMLENSRLGLIESVHEIYWKTQHPSRPLAPA